MNRPRDEMCRGQGGCQLQKISHKEPCKIELFEHCNNCACVQQKVKNICRFRSKIYEEKGNVVEDLGLYMQNCRNVAKNAQ
jgi:hypothetical protein